MFRLLVSLWICLALSTSVNAVSPSSSSTGMDGSDSLSSSSSYGSSSSMEASSVTSVPTNSSGVSSSYGSSNSDGLSSSSGSSSGVSSYLLSSFSSGNGDATLISSSISVSSSVMYLPSTSVGTISISIMITLPTGLNSSGLVSFEKAFVLDVADNLAVPLKIQPSTLVPFIEVESITGVSGLRRRLLQTSNIDILILNNISTVVKNASTSNPTQIAYSVAQILSSIISNGSFNSNHSRAGVAAQTVVITDVNPPSISSTGSAPTTSSSNESLALGLGIGLGVGLGLIVLVVLGFYLFRKTSGTSTVAVVNDLTQRLPAGSDSK